MLVISWKECDFIVRKHLKLICAGKGNIINRVKDIERVLNTLFIDVKVCYDFYWCGKTYEKVFIFKERVDEKEYEISLMLKHDEPPQIACQSLEYTGFMEEIIKMLNHDMFLK